MGEWHYEEVELDLRDVVSGGVKQEWGASIPEDASQNKWEARKKGIRPRKGEKEKKTKHDQEIKKRTRSKRDRRRKGGSETKGERSSNREKAAWVKQNRKMASKKEIN